MVKIECAYIGCNKEKEFPELTNGMKMLGVSQQIWFCNNHTNEMIKSPCDQCGFSSCKHQIPHMYDKNGKIIPKVLRAVRAEYNKKIKPMYR